MKLAGMTASVAGSYAKGKVRSILAGEKHNPQEEWQAAGELIAKTLGEMKGAVMKVGQIASQARDILPPEIANALATLQNEAPPMPWPVIAQQIEREFGLSPDRLFAHFETEPFAAASIGQVHRARTDDGREVVVKVQYPGVDTSVDSDLSHLRLALRAAGVLKLNRKAMDALFDELRARIHEELDYTLEAENVLRFQKIHADDENIIIPEVIGERSSRRVLTMAWEPGERLDRLNPDDYPQELRNKLGERIFHAFASQIFRHGVIHGDPHPGNFAFRPDGTVVIYDFGCIKELNPDAMQAYRDLIGRSLRGEWDKVDEAMIRLGARTPDGPPLDQAFYQPWRDLFIYPFSAGVQPYNFGESTVHTHVKKLVPSALKNLASLQPPAETIFVDRVIGGHYWTMVKLGVIHDFRSKLLEFLPLSEDDLRKGGILAPGESLP